jgi:hypothetical protein
MRIMTIALVALGILAAYDHFYMHSVYTHSVMDLGISIWHGWTGTSR